jgi:hypothetical protein
MMRNELLTLIPGLSTADVGARLGIKGSDAPALLQHLGLCIPALPNRVVHWPSHEPFGSGRCLRQGSTEFLIELDAGTIPDLPVNPSFPNAWRLARCDHSLLLRGAEWPRALAQVCSFDFARLDDEPDQVVMTLVAGIGVTLIRDPPRHEGDMSLRLWCDASFSVYLQQCLFSLGASR